MFLKQQKVALRQKMKKQSELQERAFLESLVPVSLECSLLELVEMCLYLL